MKNLIKGVIFASFALSFAACNNDKSATGTASTAATTATTAPMDTIGAAATSMAAGAATTATTAAGAVATTVAGAANTVKAQVEPVKPSTAQTTPAPPPPAPAATGKTTSIKFDESSYNWGSVNEGEKMTHNFKFKNTGANDLIISDAHGSCGCTVPEWPKEPIKPGKSGEVKVVFDSKGKPGENTKTVTLTANTDPGNTILTIKGSVKAAAAPAASEEKK